MLQPITNLTITFLMTTTQLNQLDKYFFLSSILKCFYWNISEHLEATRLFAKGEHQKPSHENERSVHDFLKPKFNLNSTDS